MTRTRCAAALTALLAATACGHGSRPTSTPSGSAEPRPKLTVTVPELDDLVDLVDDLDTELLDDLDADVLTLDLDPTPTGTVASIGLRYLQALQRRDWIGAARLLSLPERQTLSLTSRAYVAAVGRDVLDNAGGPRLGRCTSARPVNSDAAAVRCGRVQVVVHVQSVPILRGVQLDSVFVLGDHVDGPHTHVYRGLLP